MDAEELTGSLKKLVMWYKVKELKSKGLNKTQIARCLGINRNTVRKYQSMSESEFMNSQSYRRFLCLLAGEHHTGAHHEGCHQFKSLFHNSSEISNKIRLFVVPVKEP